MRTLLPGALVLCAACAPSSTALTLNTAAINANTAAVDRLVADIERQPTAQQPQPAAQRPPAHVVCRDGKLQGVDAPAKGEHDLGAHAASAPPNTDAPCVGGEPLSNVEARCRAGKP